MDCRTARQYLDCLHVESSEFSGGVHSTDGHSTDGLSTDGLSGSVPSPALMEHIDQCPACRQLFEEWQHFDRRMFSILMSSTIPAGLEERLLMAVDQEFAARDTAPSLTAAVSTPSPTRSGRPARKKVWTVLAVTTALLMVGTFWWTRPHHEELLSYHGAGQLLAEHFLNSNDGWDQLDQFDGNFDLGSSQLDLGGFELSPAHGIDLGGGLSQDAAVFEFGLKSWKGIITVLPSQHFTGLPDVGTSSVQAGHSVLQWRSSDGKLTYICFVHRGSAAALAQELFGLLT